MSPAARLSVVSLLHVPQRRPNGLVHAQLQGHLFEHAAHGRLRRDSGSESRGSCSGLRPCSCEEMTSPPDLPEEQLLEHGDADLVVQTDFGLKLFDSEFVDPC